ncbi:hypothetical protein [Actinacidiphila sp. bgisy144]|uniref:hypothetical protein n=1 Tax=Actinacidiphila sp. bgisy144 TaxID=3413791 RepID=UPI003EB89611
MHLARTRARTAGRRLVLAAAVLGLAVAAPAAAAQADSTRSPHRAGPISATHTDHTTGADQVMHPDHTTGADPLTGAIPVAGADHTTGSDAPKATSAARSGDPQSTADRVADFYGAYIDVVWDARNDDLRNGLREHYLTTGFQKTLAAWEAAQHADGVLRAQDSPIGWQVTPDGTDAGHAFSTVRLSWGNPSHPGYTYLKVRSDLATKQISDIEDA